MSMQIPGPTGLPSIAPTSAAHVAAFNATREEIDALPGDKLSAIFVDVIGVSSRVAASARLAEKYDPELAELPNTQGLRARVGRHALAAAYAQHLLNGEEAPEEDIAPMVEELRSLRERFLADAKALVLRKVLKPEQIQEVTGSLAYDAVTREVQHLCFVFQNNWARIAGRSGLVAEEVEAAVLLAERCEEALAMREKNEAEKAEAADIRQRAFTLLDDSYDQLRRALAHILWDDPEALSDLAPPIAAQRGRSSSKRKAEAPVATPTASGPASPVGGAAPTATASAAGGAGSAGQPVAQANGQPRPGMPDAGPFVK